MRYIKSFDNDAAIQAAVDDKSLGKPYIALDDATGKIDWNGKEISPAKEYFSIKALESGNLTVRKNCQYSVNEGEWVSASNPTTISLNAGDAVRFKGNVSDANGMFSGNTIQSDVYGNIMSLKYGDNFANATDIFASQQMFRDYTGLKNSNRLVLPAIKLSTGCYNSMFYGCSSLITAPVLAATTLRDGCYRFMFQGCTSLTTAPELKVTTISSFGRTNTYESMFIGCTNLNYVKCLLSDTYTANNTTTNWLSGVSPTGTFVKKAGVTWPSGASGIPSGWTVIEE